jgi:hypothetical protein
LLKYGFKNALAAMERLGRYSVDGQIIYFLEQMCQAGPDIPMDIQYDEQYEMYPTSNHFARTSRAKTWYLFLWPCRLQPIFAECFRNM